MRYEIPKTIMSSPFVGLGWLVGFIGSALVFGVTSGMNSLSELLERFQGER